MAIKIFKDYTAMSSAAADLIIMVVKRKPASVLCFATGNTPVLTYQLLVEKVKTKKINFSQCFCIGLDEWLGVAPDKSGSCHYILQKQVFVPLGIKKDRMHIFDGLATNPGDECSRMNDIIESKGGIDFMLAGVGTNGHVGFNEPGVDMGLNAHVQELHETTLASGQDYFNEPTEIKKGITLGMAQVMQAGTLLLLANGKNKAAIIKQALQGEVSAKVPASYVQHHNNAVVMLDGEAASALSI
jgi:galactosamine-6-phosphate isomerase